MRQIIMKEASARGVTIGAFWNEVLYCGLLRRGEI